MPQTAVLTTDRLVLRPLKPSDAGMIALYAGEERVARMTTSIPHPLPPGAAAAFVETSLGPDADEMVWAIAPRDADHDGLVGLISIDREGELGYWVGAPFWNAGFATEAVEALLSHLFSAGRAVILATVFQDNPQSAKVLSKAGFAYIGEDEAFSVARGATVPRWLYMAERGAWTRQRD